MLPDNDPAKALAALVAAEAWARSAETLQTDLAVEIATAREVAAKYAEDTAYREQVEAHRNRWGPVARSTVAPFAERRRARIEAAAPRSDDYLGRG